MPSATRLAALAAPLADARTWLDLAISAIVPPSCVACRGPVAHVSDPLCPACRAALPWLRGPSCERCALPLPCGHGCRARGGPIDRAWAPLAHEGTARAVVHAFKLRGALRLADTMAAQIAAGAPRDLLAPAAVLVPVPTAARRARRRGFDHTGLLVAALARRVGLEAAPCLRRRGSVPRQAGASRAERLASGRVEVVATGPAPTRAILVDDVHTTGATLAACASALRAAGAQRVGAVTYARALR